MKYITSAQNPLVKEIKALFKHREREESGKFLIEGFREISRALHAKVKLESLFICPDLFLGTNEKELIELADGLGAKILSCSDSLFRSFSYRDRPDGLLAVAYQEHRTLNSLVGKKNPFFVVAESIEKPGNLGTILRSADAAGATGVIVCDPVTDIYNPNVVRASIGTLFTIPIVKTTSREALQWLQKENAMILAATPSAEVSFTEITLDQSVAIVVGAEQYGLSNIWMDRATKKVRIPMSGVADSLNVAMAATLLLFEVRRQRGPS